MRPRSIVGSNCLSIVCLALASTAARSSRWDDQVSRRGQFCFKTQIRASDGTCTKRPTNRMRGCSRSTQLTRALVRALHDRNRCGGCWRRARTRGWNWIVCSRVVACTRTPICRNRFYPRVSPRSLERTAWTPCELSVGCRGTPAYRPRFCWVLRIAALMPLLLAAPVLALGAAGYLTAATPAVTAAAIGWLACSIPSPQDFSVAFHAEQLLEEATDTSAVVTCSRAD